MAVELIAGGGVDLVLSDVQLPGRSGLWLAEWVHAIRPALPVVLMSGTLPEGGLLPPSVRRFFRKPIDPETLLEALASVRASGA
jgi:CheY-like chemotaxis protein